MSLASVDAGDLALNFRGRLVAGEGGNRLPAISRSRARMAPASPRSPGCRRRCGSTACPWPARSSSPSTAGSIALERLALNIGGSDVKGQICDRPAGDRRRVEARLDVEELSLARMLAPLLDQRLAVAAPPRRRSRAARARGPTSRSTPPSSTASRAASGSTAKRLLLADGIGLGRPASTSRSQGGKVDVKQIEGACLGGRCSAM